jgi:hypothetical protein
VIRLDEKSNGWNFTRIEPRPACVYPGKLKVTLAVSKIIHSKRMVVECMVALLAREGRVHSAWVALTWRGSEVLDILFSIAGIRTIFLLVLSRNLT